MGQTLGQMPTGTIYKYLSYFGGLSKVMIPLGSLERERKSIKVYEQH